MSEKSTARRATVALTATLVLLAGGVVAFVLLSQPGGPLAPARSQSAGSDTTSQSASSGSAATSTSATTTPATTTADPLGNGRLAKMIASGDIKSIRLIGDSITAGWLCDGFGEYPDTDVVIYSGPQGTYNETSPQVACWANDFRTWASAHGVTSFVNAGIPGFRMEYLAQAPDAWLADGADLTVVMLGTNDACHCSVDEFRAFAATGIAAAAEKSKELVVVCPPDNARTDASPLYGMDQIASALEAVCAEQGRTCVSQLDTLKVDTADFNEDNVHPTSAGSHMLWQALKSKLEL